MNEFVQAWAFTLKQRETAAQQIAEMCGGDLLQAREEKYIHNPLSSAK